MMRALIATCVLLACSAAQAQTAPDPLAPARAGMAQCYTPDIAAKACRAIGTYRFNPDGTIASDAVVMMNASPFVVMTMTSPAFVRGAEVCGNLALSDLDAATFEIDGVAATAEQTDYLRTTIKQQLASMVGEICSSFTEDATGIAVASTFNGQAMAALNDRMIWIQPTDGYVVRAPR